MNGPTEDTNGDGAKLLAAVVSAERTEAMSPDEVAVWRASMPTGMVAAAEHGGDENEMLARAIMFCEATVAMYRAARANNERIGVYTLTDEALGALSTTVEKLAPKHESIEEMVRRRMKERKPDGTP